MGASEERKFPSWSTVEESMCGWVSSREADFEMEIHGQDIYLEVLLGSINTRRGRVREAEEAGLCRGRGHAVLHVPPAFGRCFKELRSWVALQVCPEVTRH